MYIYDLVISFIHFNINQYMQFVGVWGSENTTFSGLHIPHLFHDFSTQFITQTDLSSPHKPPWQKKFVRKFRNMDVKPINKTPGLKSKILNRKQEKKTKAPSNQFALQNNLTCYTPIPQPNQFLLSLFFLLPKMSLFVPLDEFSSTH